MDISQRVWIMNQRDRYRDQTVNAFTLTRYTHVYIQKTAFANIRMFITLFRNCDNLLKAASAMTAGNQSLILLDCS